MATIQLKSGREKSLLRRHPWVFSGAIASVQGDPQPGETVDVVSSQGRFLARGAYSPQSQIVVRIWSFEADEHITPAFFRERLQRAINGRNLLRNNGTATAYRLVNAESDGLPGLIVDRYADFLVCQFLTAGVERWKQEIITALSELLPVQGIYERSDVDVRQKEGLPESAGLLNGQEPPERIEIQEGSLRFLVDVRRGHKTGFYLDQRENRAILAEYAHEAEVLNCFAYTGGFGVAALQHGAKHVTHVDTSAESLERARDNTILNRLNAQKAEFVQADVFRLLRRYVQDQRQFDLIILDPPKFADSHKNLKSACRGYKDINLLGMKLLRPGGMLFTFSCSGLITPELFQKIVADAAIDAHCEAQMLRRLSQAADHPVALSFPEGLYLKGLVCQVW